MDLLTVALLMFLLVCILAASILYTLLGMLLWKEYKKYEDNRG